MNWLGENWQELLLWTVVAIALYGWAWPRHEDGTKMGLVQSMDFYDAHAHQLNPVRRLVLSVLIFFGWLLALLLRRRY
jgi:hypothetical protein